MLVIEHDMEFVRSLARKVTVLHEGSVLCEGSVDEVQQDERVLRGLPGPEPVADRGAPMLEVRGLNVAYGESQVLWDVSLDVPAGSVVCLMGRNGVGKTTLLKIDHGPPARPVGPASRSTGPTWAAGARRSARPAASATCRRAARSSRTSPCRRTCAWGCSAPGRDGNGGRRPARARLRAVPEAQDAAGAQGRRALGRRAAAARDRPRAPGAPEAAPDGRAHRGHPAVGDRPDRGGHRAHQGARASPCCWSSSTSSSPGGWPAAYAIMRKGTIVSQRLDHGPPRGYGQAAPDGLELPPMHLTPREQDKLLIFTAAELARRRRARGLKLNYPEALALITAEVLEGIRDGRSVSDLMAFGITILDARRRDGRRARDARGGPGRGHVPGRHQARHDSSSDPVGRDA